MTKRSILTIKILFATIFLALAILAVYNFNLRKVLPVKPQREQQAKPGWRIYKNERYGFSFQYPEALTSEENFSSSSPSGGDVIYSEALNFHQNGLNFFLIGVWNKKDSDYLFEINANTNDSDFGPNTSSRIMHTDNLGDVRIAQSLGASGYTFYTAEIIGGSYNYSFELSREKPDASVEKIFEDIIKTISINNK